MNTVRAIAGVMVLWAGTAWGATLTWNANSEPDMAGYRVYQCSQQPCTRASGHASLLVTLGPAVSFNIGTPAVTQYYFITAYDFANNESSNSTLVTFTPAGSPPPPPPTTGMVSLTVVGDPATGPWGVTATTSNTQDVMAHVLLDGVKRRVENHAPYDFFPNLYGTGSHTVEFVFYRQGTTTEIGRASVTVLEGRPAPSAPPMGTVRLTVVGNPATGPWGVNGSTTNPQDVMAVVRFDGVMHHTENQAPYSFPGDNGTTVATGVFGTGSHTVEFVFYRQGTTTEIGRASITVMEGNPAPSAPAARAVKLTVVGNPATGPWGVNATTTNTKDVMAYVRLDGVLQYVENSVPYDFFPKLYGTGPHTVEFVFYLQNTTSEIGRATVTVKEGG